MSLHHLTAALYADHKDLDPTARLILVVLADHAGTEGVAWPSRQTMARAAGCSVDTVDRRLAILVDRGLIREALPDQTPAAWHSWRPDRRPRAYQLPTATGPQVAAPQAATGPQTKATGPQNEAHGAADVRHEPKEPNLESARPRAHARADQDVGPPMGSRAVNDYDDTQALIQETNRRRGLGTDHAAGAAKARAGLAAARNQ